MGSHGWHRFTSQKTARKLRDRKMRAQSAIKVFRDALQKANALYELTPEEARDNVLDELTRISEEMGGYEELQGDK